MIRRLQMNTADTAHTGIYASVTRPFPDFWARQFIHTLCCYDDDIFFFYETFMLSKGYTIAWANRVCTYYKIS